MKLYSRTGHHQSMGEEIANSISHGIGFAAAVAVTPVLFLSASRTGSLLKVLGALIFAGSMLLLYFISSLYHALPQGGAKRILRVLDHAAIFVLIAGTYTPFTFGVLHGTLGWILFGTVWSLAMAGVLMKLTGVLNHPFISNGMYLGMGWLIVTAIHPLWQQLPSTGLILLIAGGVAYTGGILFYLADHMRYNHFVWHLFVLTGTVCHCSVIYLFCY